MLVFDEELAIDYRMGPEWGPRELRGLFQLMLELSRLDLASKVALEPGTPPEIT